MQQFYNVGGPVFVWPDLQDVLFNVRGLEEVNNSV